MGTSVVRSHARAAVRVQVRTDRAALLTLSVRNPRTGRALRLEPGSRVAATILKRPAAVIRGALLEARSFVVEAVLRTAALTRGRTYELVLNAVGVAGKRSGLTIEFRG